MTFFDSFRKETKPVKGTVERFGPSFGAGQINGYIALLVGDRTPYVILRDNQETDTTVGLTAPGDPEFGAHLMGWSNAQRRWEGWAFALMRKVPTWWDESQPQPTHWKHAD